MERDYQILRLGPDDLTLMSELVQMFGEVFDEPETYTGRPPDADYLRQLLSNGAFIALVARQEAVVVGGLAAYDLKKFEQARSEIYIYDLAVAASQRRQGIATALVREVVAIGAACGAHTVFVQADTGVEDEPAIALYRTLGREESVLHFDIAVRNAAAE